MAPLWSGVTAQGERSVSVCVFVCACVCVQEREGKIKKLVKASERKREMCKQVI